jgi:hypothetical protein
MPFTITDLNEATGRSRPLPAETVREYLVSGSERCEATTARSIRTFWDVVVVVILPSVLSTPVVDDGWSKTAPI